MGIELFLGLWLWFNFQDIKFTANVFDFISFKYIYKEINFVTDKLAHLDYSTTSTYVWFNYVPLFVSLVLDQLGRDCSRDFVL